jgi:hypothetical protein
VSSRRGFWITIGAVFGGFILIVVLYALSIPDVGR